MFDFVNTSDSYSFHNFYYSRKLTTVLLTNRSATLSQIYSKFKEKELHADQPRTSTDENNSCPNSGLLDQSRLLKLK